MLILGIESAGSQVGCAIGGHEGVLASAHTGRGRRHAESLTPQMDFVRKQAGIEFSDLGAIAVDVGPGLYTGLRVGITAGVSLAHALGVPMIGVCSLDLLAFPARWTNRLIVTALDARRGELFTALFRKVPGGVQRVREAQVCTPEELATELMDLDEPSLLVGDGALRYADTFASVKKIEMAEQGLASPSARSLVQLAHARAMREEFVQSWELKPVYLRQPDAEINWVTRGDQS
ncbi:MAG TPA: tRNA (adenosine(37)-N6)-threonylcarbamoyltransferase complex dimerization subunit type 1 TsaB [Acidimicrobiia bacterium]|nr:tRNA (adenosine(37)-N6)-threonylcarbamoyltransferase complex dimerization subunit type 1 TsaB [Actinomycetota bacterium]HIG25639.1 tRNA (adenosine(37)-N6)-threonylcarbamoyltransferase complex dimerization subunit type 1 TsaB [Acidimicrobiia bacterium]MBT3745706.1 tRNA (adenosine(37)-N6)-threonylcarbamoyltransferase complex dimerization subunit type 1 TsaB [Actinomycetota bacterium]MBT3969103.1 tRNA (adenosine(37)-N6)-threonylcarbamoyltransferase complex dimerization subunit type 1 TsaB [Actin